MLCLWLWLSCPAEIYNKSATQAFLEKKSKQFMLQRGIMIVRISCVSSGPAPARSLALLLNSHGAIVLVVLAFCAA